MDNKQILTLITKVKREVKRLENTTVGNLAEDFRVFNIENSTLKLRVSEIETKTADLELENSTLKLRVSEIETKIENYITHTHSYKDNDGTIITDKTTGEVN